MVWIESVLSLAYHTQNVAAKKAAERRRRHLERNFEVVAQVVGDERADDADHDDCYPIDAGRIRLRSHLHKERKEQECAHDHGCGRQS